VTEPSELIDCIIPYRDRLAELLKGSEGFLDENFEEKFAQDPEGRVWELMVFQMLRRSGHKLTPTKGHGPDFRIETADGPIWVEATAPGRGVGPDRVPEIDPDCNEMRPVPVDQVILRVTQALREKECKRQSYIESGLVSDDDPYVVAISGAKMIETFGSHPSFGLRALFGIGNPEILIDRETGETVELRYQRIERVVKQSNVAVSARAFIDGHYPGISAVIWSDQSIWRGSYGLIKGLEVIHNNHANRRLYGKLIADATDYWPIVCIDEFECKLYRT